MRNQTIYHFISIIKQSDRINAKEKDVLIKRIEGKELREIGNRYKVTGERIRQIEKTAIMKFLKKIHQLLLFESR